MKTKVVVALATLLAVLAVGTTSASASKCKIIVNGVVVQDNNDSPCIYNATNTGSGGTVTNNIKVKAKTGKNTSGGGTIVTGNAQATVNITNNVNVD